MEYFRHRYLDEVNEGGAVRVRAFEWPAADVLATMSPGDYERDFEQWVEDAKSAAKERCLSFLQELGCLDRFNRLHAQMGTLSVVPFVGAGMSASTGFPLWGEFLLGQAKEFPSIVEAIQQNVDRQDYEEAAQLLLDHAGSDILAEAIQSTFGSRLRPLRGPVKLLPLLFGRGCITTNFDYILNRVYHDAGASFEGEFIGASIREALRRIADMRNWLIRLHGEADSSDGRVLARSEYDAAYSDSQIYVETINRLVGNNSLLFLGASISADRTFAALREIKRTSGIETPRHFAFLPLGQGIDREQRRTELAAADIHPIWYPPDDHDQALEDLLITLLAGGLHG